MTVTISAIFVVMLILSALWLVIWPLFGQSSAQLSFGDNAAALREQANLESEKQALVAQLADLAAAQQFDDQSASVLARIEEVEKLLSGLPKRQNQAPAPAAELSVCPHCQKKLQQKTPFCPYCGGKLA